MKRWVKGSYVKFGPRRFRNNPNETLGADSDQQFAVETGDFCQDDDPAATLVTSLTDIPDWMNMAFGYDDSEGGAGEPANQWLHWPVIDIDRECAWVPSTNPGHGHLYINYGVSFDGLIEILTVLTKHGVVQPGFLDAAKERGYSAVRVPGVKKPS